MSNTPMTDAGATGFIWTWRSSTYHASAGAGDTLCGKWLWGSADPLEDADEETAMHSVSEQKRICGRWRKPCSMCLQKLQLLKGAAGDG